MNISIFIVSLIMLVLLSVKTEKPPLDLAKGIASDFKQYDQNKDHFLTKDELSELVEAKVINS